MTNPKILYHYCPTAAFHSIVETRSIRLTSLSLSNDTMEGKLVEKIISELAKRDNLNSSIIERILNIVQSWVYLMDGLGFCLSENGDLLSQWRGYASDASGVSIGFSCEYLEWLSGETCKNLGASAFKLEKVFYERKRHEEEVWPTYHEIKKIIVEGDGATPGLNFDSKSNGEPEQEKKAYDRVRDHIIVLLITKLFLLKSSSFQEELEWRLLSHSTYFHDKNSAFRVLSDKVIPYRKYELIELVRKPIVEVVLGPKHLTPIKIIKDFLRCYGFGDVNVRKSEVTYR
jgi:hypothetical protein